MMYEDLLRRQRIFFGSGKTRSYAFRVNALVALRETLVFYEEEIQQALLDDLNKSPYETFITEYGLALQQIHHVQRGLKKWYEASPQSGWHQRSASLADEMRNHVMQHQWRRKL